jgi:hypothetical protein
MPRSNSPQAYPNVNNFNGYNGGAGRGVTPTNMNQNYAYMQPVAQPTFQPAPQPPHLNKFQSQQQLPPQQQQQQQQQPFFNPMQQANLFNDPMANMAVKYGANLADQGKEYVAQNVDRWFSLSQLKYYFAVDTNYVARKLLLLLFPFANQVFNNRMKSNH